MGSETGNGNDGICANFIHKHKCNIKANCYFFTSHLLVNSDFVWVSLPLLLILLIKCVLSKGVNALLLVFALYYH